MGNRVIIANPGSTAVTLRLGTVLLGFGRVTWRRVKPEEAEDPVPSSEMPVIFKSSSDKIMIGTSLMTLKEAVETRRKTHSTVNVCYHKIVEDVNSTVPGDFLVQTTSTVHARFEPTTVSNSSEGQTSKQDVAGASLPLASWDDVGVVKPVWSMR